MADMYGDPNMGGAFGGQSQWTFSSAVGGNMFGTMPNLPPGYSRIEYERERAFASGQYTSGLQSGLTSIGGGAVLGYAGLRAIHGEGFSARTRLGARIWGADTAVTAGRATLDMAAGYSVHGLGSGLGRGLGNAVGGIAEVGMQGIGRGLAWATRGMGNAISSNATRAIEDAAGSAGGFLARQGGAWAQESGLEAVRANILERAIAGKAPETFLQAVRAAENINAPVLKQGLFGLSANQIGEVSSAGRAASWGKYVSAAGEFIHSPIKSLTGGGARLVRAGFAGAGAATAAFLLPALLEGYAIDKVTQFATNPFENWLNESSFDKDMFEKSKRILKYGGSDSEMGLSGGFTAAQRARVMGTMRREAEMSTRGSDWLGNGALGGAGGHFGGFTAYSDRFKELNNIFNVGSDAGVLDSRSMEEFEKKFKQLVDTADKVGKIMRGSKEKVIEFVRQMDTMGFHDIETAGKNLGYTVTSAKMRGTTPERVLAEMQGGSEYYKSQGFNPQGGAVAFQRAGRFVDTAFRTGAISKEMFDMNAGKEGLLAQFGSVALGEFQNDKAMRLELAQYAQRDAAGNVSFDKAGFLKAMGAPVTSTSAAAAAAARGKLLMSDGNGGLMDTALGGQRAQMVEELARRGDITQDMLSMTAVTMVRQANINDPILKNLSLEQINTRRALNTGMFPEIARLFGQYETGAFGPQYDRDASVAIRDEINDRNKESKPGWWGLLRPLYSAIGLVRAHNSMMETGDVRGFVSRWDSEAANAYAGSTTGDKRKDLIAGYLRNNWSGEKVQGDVVGNMDFLTARSALQSAPGTGEKMAATSDLGRALGAYAEGSAQGSADTALIAAGRKQFYDVAGTDKRGDLFSYISIDPKMAADERTALMSLKGALGGARTTVSAAQMGLIGKHVEAAKRAMAGALTLPKDKEFLERGLQQGADLPSSLIIETPGGARYTPEGRRELAMFGPGGSKEAIAAAGQGMREDLGSLIGWGYPTDAEVIDPATENMAALGSMSSADISLLKNWYSRDNMRAQARGATKFSVGPGGEGMTKEAFIDRMIAGGYSDAGIAALSKDTPARARERLERGDYGPIGKGLDKLLAVKALQNSGVMWGAAREFTRGMSTQAKSSKEGTGVQEFFEGWAGYYGDGAFDKSALDKMLGAVGKIDVGGLSGGFRSFSGMFTDLQDINKNPEKFSSKFGAFGKRYVMDQEKDLKSVRDIAQAGGVVGWQNMTKYDELAAGISAVTGKDAQANMARKMTEVTLAHYGAAGAKRGIPGIADFSEATSESGSGAGGALDVQGLPAAMQNISKQSSQTAQDQKDTALLLEKMMRQAIAHNWN